MPGAYIYRQEKLEIFMKKLITDSFMIGQIKERIRRMIPKLEKLDVKVELTSHEGYLATIKFRCLGREFIAKKTAPFYRESLERSMRAINSQIDKFRRQRLAHAAQRPHPYPTLF